MYPPGLLLRQRREGLGLTYRDVEKASYEIALKRGRPDFILHISRLADIENRNVVPSIHKLYSLAAIYHVDPCEITSWYEAPFQQTFHDGASFPPPRTYLAERFIPETPSAPLDCSMDAQRTGLLKSPPSALALFPGVDDLPRRGHRYGYIGLSDRRMVPLLRPGSIVRVDTSLRNIEDSDWSSEYDRPFYFVELHDGYRCGWFYKEKSRLIMQPHILSHCAPESWRIPEDAEVVGKVVAVISSLCERWSVVPSTSPSARTSWSRKAL